METLAINTNEKLGAKDFSSGTDVKWCPGCGDYSILKQVQTIFPELGIPKEQFVFISGIGCSSRLPIIWTRMVFIAFMDVQPQLLPE